MTFVLDTEEEVDDLTDMLEVSVREKLRDIEDDETLAVDIDIGVHLVAMECDECGHEEPPIVHNCRQCGHTTFTPIL